MTFSSPYAPAVTIHPTGFAEYLMYYGPSGSSNQLPTSSVHTKAGLSNKQSNRIKKCFNWLYMLSKKKKVYSNATGKYYSFKVSFITLTLSAKQCHTDDFLRKNLLEKFLRRLRIVYPSLLYVWKAEVQDNGNLHFHVNTNLFIHHAKVREYWNRYQSSLGYCALDKIHDINSTDIKCVKNEKELGAYMAKYTAKGDIYNRVLKRYHKRYARAHELATDTCTLPRKYFTHLKRKITCKLWDCSSLLKKVQIRFVSYSQEIHNNLQPYRIEENKIQDDFFTYYFNIDWFKIPDNELKKSIFTRVREIIDHQASQQLKYYV